MSTPDNISEAALRSIGITTPNIESEVARARRELAEAREWLANWQATMRNVIGGDSLAEVESKVREIKAERDQLRAQVARARRIAAFKASNRYHRGHSAGYAEAKEVHEAELLRMAHRAEAAESHVRTLTQALERLKEYASELQVAEDRSNLDGDSAEEVIAQLNQSGAEMEGIILQALAATAPKEDRT